MPLRLFELRQHPRRFSMLISDLEGPRCGSNCQRAHRIDRSERRRMISRSSGSMDTACVEHVVGCAVDVIQTGSRPRELQEPLVSPGTVCALIISEHPSGKEADWALHPSGKANAGWHVQHEIDPMSAACRWEFRLPNACDFTFEPTTNLHDDETVVSVEETASSEQEHGSCIHSVSSMDIRFPPPFVTQLIAACALWGCAD